MLKFSFLILALGCLFMMAGGWAEAYDFSNSQSCLYLNGSPKSVAQVAHRLDRPDESRQPQAGPVDTEKRRDNYSPWDRQSANRSGQPVSSTQRQETNPQAVDRNRSADGSDWSLAADERRSQEMVERLKRRGEAYDRMEKAITGEPQRPEPNRRQVDSDRPGGGKPADRRKRKRDINDSIEQMELRMKAIERTQEAMTD
jgi:hypothetical protein